ncbi:CDP-diacylglycerol diphosphatase [Rosenbergiella nectarea]|uniref:CDP-diacylglycerol diphosphatase n=1 Tax=Rosenbergiella nectarea TaxID=988801 RepID=UPI001F4D4426|nr:CDP-diacylglycerol diphosphatase [Rosenbergiella nectarea]
MKWVVIKRLCLVSIIGIMVYGTWRGYVLHRNSDALWKIVSRQCVPHQQQQHSPAPCQQVDLSQGYVLLKDKIGIAQYLLIPTDKVSGIESDKLLAPTTPNYFSLAWSMMPQVSQRLEKPIPNTLLSLAINSKWGRSQNQLHIHMSCLRGDVRQRLAEKQQTLTDQWQPLLLLNHSYWVRTLSLEQLNSRSLFQRVFTELPDIDPSSGREGIAVTMLADGRLVILVLRTNWMKGILGSAEELQDHQCHAV